MEFNCKKCGLCCSRLGKAIEDAHTAINNGSQDKLMFDLIEFPYKTVNGKCENLTEDNLCKIYDTRPDICRMNKVYEKYFSEQMSKKDFYILNEKMCDEEIKKHSPCLT